jgi:hypothetical protein
VNFARESASVSKHQEDSMSDSGHGSVGTREQPFTSIIKERHQPFDTQVLAQLAESMKGQIDTVKDGADPEENLWLPAGYTYFGQFVDHDLTFDSTSSLNPEDANATPSNSRVPTNLRTPRFDLDCLYGDGPDAQPFMYADDGATLLFGGTGRVEQRIDLSGRIVEETTSWDLLRAPNGRAIIGDKRNDENSIVCQIQLGFVKYHNAVVARLRNKPSSTWNEPGSLFRSARNEVRWTYQTLLMKDFLPRLIDHQVLADLQGKTPAQRANNYALYTADLRSNLPREFVAAAYRYGHSGVRTGYRLNGKDGQTGGTSLSIFPASNQTDVDTDSMLGFDPLPKHHVIDDWARFFPHTGPGVFPAGTRVAATDDDTNGKVRLQFAYKLDPTIVDPLGVLPIRVAGAGTAAQAAKDIDPAKMPDPQRPSLALLNLLRGNAYGIQSGQALAALLQHKFPEVATLDPKYLVTRNPAGKDGVFKFVPIDPSLRTDTPLWFYVLAEAQKAIVDAVQLQADGTFDDGQLLNGAGAKTQLGWVGGRIVAEVFYGLLDADSESVVNKAPDGWKPMLGGDGSPIVANILKMAAAG